MNQWSIGPSSRREISSRAPASSVNDPALYAQALAYMEERSISVGCCGVGDYVSAARQIKNVHQLEVLKFWMSMDGGRYSLRSSRASWWLSINVRSSNQAILAKKAMHLPVKNYSHNKGNRESIIEAFKEIIFSSSTWERVQYTEKLLNDGFVPYKSKEIHEKIVGAIQGEEGLRIAFEYYEKGISSELNELIEELGKVDEAGGLEEFNRKINQLDIAHGKKEKRLVNFFMHEVPKEGKREGKIEGKLVDIIESFSPSKLSRIMDPPTDGEGLSPTEKWLAKRMAIFQEQAGKSSKLGLSESLAMRDKMRSGVRLTDSEYDKLRSLDSDSAFSKIFYNAVVKEKKDEISEIDKAVKNYLNSSQLNITPEHYNKFFNQLIPAYVEDLPTKNKESILHDLIKIGPEATEKQQFEAVVQNSGPEFQKLLQMLSRQDGLGDDFADILKKLESNIKETPFTEVEKFLIQEFGELYPSRLKILNKHPLGVGTMAQTYRGEMLNEANIWEPVAVRVLKPEIEEAVETDYKLLQKHVSDIEVMPEMRGTLFEHFGNVLERLHNTIRGELNTGETGLNQISGSKYYGPRPHLGDLSDIKSIVPYTPKVIHSDNNKSGLLIQELVNGEPFEIFFKVRPAATKVSVVEDMAKLWLREAIFISGFHHADLHQGNMLFKELNNNKIEVQFLDYGMAKTLNKDERKALIMLGKALKDNNLESAIKITTSSIIDSKNTASIKSIASEFFSSPNREVKEFLEFLISKNVLIKEELVSFNRGLWLISQLLENAKSSILIEDLLEEMTKELAGIDAKNRFKIFNKTKDWVDLTPFSKKELLKLGKEKAGSCSQLIKMMF